MREMKDSGVEWLGEIDSSFCVASIGTLFTIKKDIIGHEPTQVLSITQSGVRPRNTESNEGQNANSYEHYQIVNIGDYAMNHMDLLTGWIDISKYEGVTSPDYRVFTLNDKKMIAEYFLRVFQYYYANRIFFGFGQGVATLGRWRLPAQNFKSISIPIPPIDVQSNIVAALDNKCGQVDSLIANEQKQIEKLKQYKQSLITEVVTKGLDPSASMKDSGVEWIGEIPTNWDEIKLKYCTYIRARLGWKGLKSDEYVEEGYPLLSAYNIINSKLDFCEVNFINQFRYDESPEIKLAIDDILLVKDGAGIGKCAIVEDLPFPSTANGSLAVVTAVNRINPKYLYYYLLSAYFQKYIDRIKDGMGVPHLFQSDLREILVVVPSEPEQREIIVFLESKCAQVDKLISIKQTKIDKLNAYKKSLIYEYVTGKKEA